MPKGPIPPTLWSFDEAIQDYEYNPELARQILAEARFPDGFETTLWALPVPRPYIPDGMALAEALQSDLRDVGIEASIETFDWGTYLDKTEIGEHDRAMLGWIVSEGDPDSFFYYQHSKTYAEKPAFNIAFYRSGEMHEILDRARTSTNRGERTELYPQSQAIFHRDAPWVPLAHAQRLLVVNWRVKNLRLAPTGLKYLRSLSVGRRTHLTTNFRLKAQKTTSSTYRKRETRHLSAKLGQTNRKPTLHQAYRTTPTLGRLLLAGTWKAVET